MEVVVILRKVGEFMIFGMLYSSPYIANFSSTLLWPLKADLHPIPF